jgi:hypothetical protein
VTRTTKPLTFKAALKKLPRAAHHNFDHFYHKTIEDLAFCAKHELDLYLECEPNEIKSQREFDRLKAYYELLTGKIYRH